MVGKLLITAGLLGFTAIALGAYGDHGLRPNLDTDNMRSYETAIRYQLIHALALLVIGLTSATPSISPTLLKRILYSGVAMLAGTVVFSGSIYLKVIFGLEAAQKFAPLGGMTLMAGWLMLMWAGYIKKDASI
jgi:uncharacterized membrane protein YgdD (TMEM256/DUF423 family)